MVKPERALVGDTLVPVRAPFRLDLTANVLRRLSTNVVDHFDGATYRRLIGDPRKPSLVSVTQPAPDAVAVRIEGPAFATGAHALVGRLLGTDVALDAFYRGARGVPWLERIATGARGVKPPRYPTLWEAVVNAVVFQQVSIHAAAAILRRTIERFGEPMTIAGLPLYPFPAPETIADADPEELRAAGLSVNKIVALRTIARSIVAGDLDETVLDRLPTAELTAALVVHKGIGPWTAAVIGLRGFGRLDLFPMNDSGVAKSVRELTGGAAVDVDAVLGRLGAQRGMLYYHLLLGRLAARGDVELAATPPGS